MTAPRRSLGSGPLGVRSFRLLCGGQFASTMGDFCCSFPLSVAESGVLVHHLGPTPFFPVAGALVAVAILGGLTQREFRAFGATVDGGDPVAVAQAADDLKAAEGSRK